MARCRSCDAEIVWVLTQAGKRMPIDREPVEDGNVVIIGQTADRDPLVRCDANPEQVDLLGGERYVSHFATCPHADRHRQQNR